MYDPPAPSAGGIESVPLEPPRVSSETQAPPGPPPPSVSSHGPWTMTMFDFSEGGGAPAPKPIPEQRTGEADPAAPQQPPVPPEAAPGRKGRRERKPKAAPAPRKARAKAGAGSAPASAKGVRKPSPLLLLSCGLLTGGAVSGFFPAMLVGWGLGYLSRQMSDLMRKFVILGIPLVTMSVTTLLAMQRAKQAAGAGAGVQTSAPLGQFSWSMAPGVLRTAAGVTAAVLLLVALRRRPPQQG
ncbi:hypothetical protein [Streptomyces sp. NRRL WC-3742]|uniref:hypothetical protein n=1 Tax=Streptomyces sp. NRRL WC-3742 TaxID=1463934 RepID=UPI000AF00E98|nr:hypothetical protein [Streptomyces sp. NRRL WC-3742]